MLPKFLSPEPLVRLEKAFANPFGNVVATARTCYSAKGIISDEQIGQEMERIARLTYQAGHHTVYQHATFQFSLANVSRQFIWSFLHSHPFYNSEQVSQRYVEVKPGNYAIPPLEASALEIYTQTVEFQTEAYRKLIERLSPIVEAEFFRIFPARRKYREHYAKTIQRRAQEIARYVLPVATFAYLYHTISGITLLRYYRLCQQYDAPLEQRIVVSKMVEELLKADPLYQIVLEQSLDLEETPEAQFFTRGDTFVFAHREEGTQKGKRAFLEEFDASLQGRVSKLVDYKTHNEEMVAQSVREVLGVTRHGLGDDEAIELVLHPGKNRLLSEALNLTTHSKLSRTLFHASYTFRKKLSHTADSQDQRHRMTPASRPCLHAHFTGEPDYITPELVKQEAQVQRYYDEAMDQVWTNIRRLKALGVSDEFAMYLLPNAVAIRFTESADLLNLHHKHALRLCYLAQEEIWRASVDEAQQIREVNPRIGKYLLPPCTIRYLAEKRPVCPEGDRYCGERVWRYDLSEYRRLI